MCGILGIVGNTDVAAQLYDGLSVLQHRGQDAAGIATADGGKLRVQKGNGLVSDVFDADSMQLLQGRFGIAHCRYPTAVRRGRTKRSRSTSIRPMASRWRTTAT
jgi:amidophosphoribosyltransferase